MSLRTQIIRLAYLNPTVQTHLLRCLSGSLRQQQEKLIAKWVASYVVKQVKPEKFMGRTIKLKDMEPKIQDAMRFLDLKAVHLEIKTDMEVEHYDSGWNYDSISIGYDIPTGMPKSTIYNRIYAMTLHELTHARQAVKDLDGGEEQGDTPLDYVLSKDETEAFLKQFRSIARHDGVSLESVIRENFKELVENPHDMDRVVKHYLKESQRIYRN